ncbi:hypothetical protein [Parafrankia sp. BMG5.11]|uniref:hypothetical protein n=1 Tax=Parafrankia sp. BMG5.11 TaxID=222540 RepID=UPI00103BDA8A|nr:hypothetical protein [Parafrankia sp. BMG5.11]TCJ32434.1 hypothetical protein E0504_42910 [Parafrankia sp. BMG5.11]
MTIMPKIGRTDVTVDPSGPPPIVCVIPGVPVPQIVVAVDTMTLTITAGDSLDAMACYAGVAGACLQAAALHVSPGRRVDIVPSDVRDGYDATEMAQALVLKMLSALVVLLGHADLTLDQAVTLGNILSDTGSQVAGVLRA